MASQWRGLRALHCAATPQDAMSDADFGIHHQHIRPGGHNQENGGIATNALRRTRSAVTIPLDGDAESWEGAQEHEPRPIALVSHRPVDLHWVRRKGPRKSATRWFGSRRHEARPVLDCVRARWALYQPARGTSPASDFTGARGGLFKNARALPTSTEPGAACMSTHKRAVGRSATGVPLRTIHEPGRLETYNTA